jgi:hypothetical protein
MLTREWLKAFAPVGIFKGGDDFVAAGASVFFQHEGLVWIVTANHVLKTIGEAKNVGVLVGHATGDYPAVVTVGKIQKDLGIDWVIDEVNDIAASLMPLSPEVNINALKAENCLAFTELLPSMPCYTIGCPYGFRGVDPQSSLPLVLDGIVAGVHRSDRQIYTTAPTFPGNSGGPLIAIRGPYSSSELSDGLHIMKSEPASVFLAGIMLTTATLAAPVGKLPNLYLGVAKSTDAVLELLKSDRAQAQVKLALAAKG